MTSPLFLPLRRHIHYSGTPAARLSCRTDYTKNSHSCCEYTAVERPLNKDLRWCLLQRLCSLLLGSGTFFSGSSPFRSSTGRSFFVSVFPAADRTYTPRQQQSAKVQKRRSEGLPAAPGAAARHLSSASMMGPPRRRIHQRVRLALQPGRIEGIGLGADEAL